LRHGAHANELCGAGPATTNNRMEHCETTRVPARRIRGRSLARKKSRTTALNRLPAQLRFGE